MVVYDHIYGSFDITEPILLELIESPSLQRLKRITQWGIPHQFYGRPVPGFSRYDHCLGVMLLLRLSGASLEEQIAGLLHDVSHTAFSHTYDWVVEDHTESGQQDDLQDRRHYDFVMRSELPGILSQFDYQSERIVDHHHYSLLEQPVPDLCADRLDYAFREMDSQLVSDSISALGQSDGRFVFTDQDVAARFAQAFLKLQDLHWGSQHDVTRFRYFAQILRWALEAGVIAETDFEIDDDHIVSKLLKTKEPLILAGLDLLKRKSLPTTAGGERLFPKFRYVDPLVKEGVRLQRLSELDVNFADKLASARRVETNGHLVPPLIELLKVS